MTVLHVRWQFGYHCRVSVINVYARMDNAYLSNEWFGGTLILGGIILLFACLVGYRVPFWLAGLLLAAYVAFAFFGLSALAQAFPFRDSATLLYPAILIGSVLLYVLIRGYVLDVLIAVALAGVGWVVVWTIYGAGFDAFTPVDSLSPSINVPIVKPPVLELGPFLACLLIALLFYIGGHFIPRIWRRDTPPHQISGADTPAFKHGEEAPSPFHRYYSISAYTF